MWESKQFSYYVVHNSIYCNVDEYFGSGKVARGTWRRFSTWDDASVRCLSYQDVEYWRFYFETGECKLVLFRRPVFLFDGISKLDELDGLGPSSGFLTMSFDETIAAAAAMQAYWVQLDQKCNLSNFYTSGSRFKGQ